MKKSNKLLLGGFLTGLLLITALHITLYAKYKAGNYTLYNAEDDLAPASVQPFPNVLFVLVRNVPDATVKFSQTAQLDKDEDNGLEYVRKGDTLLIAGKDSANQQGMRHHSVFYLPYGTTLSVFNSSLSFANGKKGPENNPTIYLQNSQAFFLGGKSPFQFGNIKVIASENSAIVFRGNVQVSHLEAQLSHSLLEDEASFGQLSILTDSASRISLQTKHLVKANIKSTAPQ